MTEKKDLKKWGGNFNCVYCSQYKYINRHTCLKYNAVLRVGRVAGLWILPCGKCHKNKTYGGKSK